MGIDEAQHLTSVTFERFPEFTSLLGFEVDEDSWESVESLEQANRSILNCKLLNEFTVQVCKIGRCQSLLGKIFNSSLFRKWYSLRLVLTGTGIRSKCPTKLSDFPISFSSLRNSKVIPFLDSSWDYNIKIPVADGYILLKTFDSYVFNQLLQVIAWKRNAWNYEQALKGNNSFEMWSKEIKKMVQFSSWTPICDPVVKQHPFHIASKLFLAQCKQEESFRCRARELASLFAASFRKSFPLSPSPDIRMFFATFGEDCFSNTETREMFFDVVEWVLKHNTDFYRNPVDKNLVKTFIRCAATENSTCLEHFARNFVARMHGSCSRCPHLHILDNLFSICMDTITRCFSLNANSNASSSLMSLSSSLEGLATDWQQQDHLYQHHHHHHHGRPRRLHHHRSEDEELGSHLVEAYLNILTCLSTFGDWRQELSGLLQSVPFPVEAFSERMFIKQIKIVLTNLIGDGRCSIHQSVLGSRPGKPGWFELCASWGTEVGFAEKEGDLHCKMLEVLLGCCCHRRKFFLSRVDLIPRWLDFAARNEASTIKALSGCLEFDVFGSNDGDGGLREQVTVALQRSEEGRQVLGRLDDERRRMNYLQSGSGPRKLSLPSKSTDLDLKMTLASGCYKDLEALSLAFTRCTGSCADDIIGLPSLKELNLWSTQFNDSGLQLICDHLHDLQVLNLCETSVTSQGLMCLASLKSLKKLNLNSTNISLSDFERLKELLPNLEEVDIRYTDAWMSFS